MTSKDYNLIAERIKLNKETFLYPENDVPTMHASFEVLALDLAEKFAEDNPRFDTESFMEACGFPLEDTCCDYCETVLEKIISK